MSKSVHVGLVHSAFLEGQQTVACTQEESRAVTFALFGCCFSSPDFSGIWSKQRRKMKESTEGASDAFIDIVYIEE